MSEGEPNQKQRTMSPRVRKLVHIMMLLAPALVVMVVRLPHGQAFELSDLVQLLEQAAPAIILAVAMCFSASLRLYDLSIGSSAVWSGVLITWLVGNLEMPVGQALIVVSVLAVVQGVVLGVVGSKLSAAKALVGFIAFAWLLNAASGSLSGSLLVENESAVFLGPSGPVLIASTVFVLIVAEVLSECTGLGVNLVAIGASPRTAARSSVSVRTHTIGVFCLSAALAAFAGLAMTQHPSGIESGFVVGESLLIDALVAVLISGAASPHRVPSPCRAAAGAVLLTAADMALATTVVFAGAAGVLKASLLLGALAVGAHIRREEMRT